MSLSPTTWEDVCIGSRVALSLPYMSVAVSLTSAKGSSNWKVTSDGHRALGPTHEVVLRAGFKDLTKKFAHRFAFIQHPNSKGRFQKRDYNQWLKKYPLVSVVEVNIHGPGSIHQSVCALFKDTAEGRESAMLFKLAYA